MIKKMCTYLSLKTKNSKKKDGIIEQADLILPNSELQQLENEQPLSLLFKPNDCPAAEEDSDLDSKQSVQIIIDMVDDDEDFKNSRQRSNIKDDNSDGEQTSDCSSVSSFSCGPLNVPRISCYNGRGGSLSSSSSSCNSWTDFWRDFTATTDEEILAMIQAGEIPVHQLEDALKDETRAVIIRRAWHSAGDRTLREVFPDIPVEDYDYKYVKGACCENVIGHIPLLLTVVGPVRINGVIRHIPLATNDAVIIRRIHQGIRAFNLNLDLDPSSDPSNKSGIKSHVYADGISRGPVVQFPDAATAVKVAEWFKVPKNMATIRESFDVTSRYLKLTQVKVQPVGRLCFFRFVAATGDAMGMNMISKGTLEALTVIRDYFPSMTVISVSGNYCTDKKPSAINWIEGRGKSVVAEGRIPGSVVRRIFRTTAEEMVKMNMNGVLLGPMMSGTVGGFNSNAAGIIGAIFAATGQDVAQTVEGSNCFTLMELVGPEKEDLYISCTLPSIEVGTVGGGTILPPQNSCLEILGLLGSDQNKNPGETSKTLAKIVAATVLAGELAITASLTRESRDLELEGASCDVDWDSDSGFRDEDDDIGEIQFIDQD